MIGLDYQEKERNRTREKYHRLGYKNLRVSRADQILAVQKYKNKFPEKSNAQNKAKKIKAPEGLEKHHWSYQKKYWLSLIFLTNADHKKLHRFLVYVAKKKIYATKEGLILDTRRKHENYIKKILALP